MKTRSASGLMTWTLAVIAAFQLLAQAAPDADPAGTKGAEPKPGAMSEDKPKAKVFEFGGGTLEEFVNAIEQQLGINLWHLGTIPEEMRRVSVPKIRIGPASLSNVLITYNSISVEGDHRLGHWIHKYTVPGQDLPGVVILVAPRDKGGQPESKLAVRAFYLRGIKPPDREKLILLIGEEAETLRLESRNGGFAGIGAEDVVGRVRYHSDTEILVAAGNESYISLAQSLVEAFRERNNRRDLMEDLQGK